MRGGRAGVHLRYVHAASSQQQATFCIFLVFASTAGSIAGRHAAISKFSKIVILRNEPDTNPFVMPARSVHFTVKQIISQWVWASAMGLVLRRFRFGFARGFGFAKVLVWFCEGAGLVLRRRLFSHPWLDTGAGHCRAGLSWSWSPLTFLLLK